LTAASSLTLAGFSLFFSNSDGLRRDPREVDWLGREDDGWSRTTLGFWRCRRQSGRVRTGTPMTMAAAEGGRGKGGGPVGGGQ